MSTASIITAMNAPEVFRRAYSGPSWDMWRSVLRAAYALPMSPEDLARFAQVSGGRAPPTRRVKECWFVCGRRGGKDAIASLIAAYAAGIEEAHLGHLRP